MTKDKSGLFLTLLKLKSYLASMIDDKLNCIDGFHFTEEYLQRRFPDKKDEIISLLEDNQIYSDCDIAFNEKIILQFRTIVNQTASNLNLPEMLKRLEIEAQNIKPAEDSRETIKSGREKKLSEILDTLFQLATNWAVLKELEDKVDDYSILNEEEVIRPDEEKNMNALDDTTDKAFGILSNLTKKYVHQLTDYYFTFGGDLALKEFVEDLNKTKKLVEKKFYELFKQHGLDTDWISKISEE